MNLAELTSLHKDRLTARLAVFVFLMRENKTFLLRRFNTGWADGMLTVPSGHIEKGETVHEAALKEVREEAGVIIHTDNLELMHVHYVQDVYVNFYFKTTIWEGEPYLAEPELCSEVLWVPVDRIPSDAVFQVRHSLRRVYKRQLLQHHPKRPKSFIVIPTMQM